MQDSIFDVRQKLDLAALIKANDVDDCTQEIRDKKQSVIIRNDVKQFVYLKQKYARLAKSNPSEFDKICVSQCQHLFNNYTDLFNKIKKDTIDLRILERFLDILKQIEDGEVDQHEGSYLVGKHLKEMYVDNALRVQVQGEKNGEKNGQKKQKPNLEKKISYREYKNQILV